MAQFIWKAYPDSGSCLACMSASNDRGFVDLIGETTLKRGEDSQEVVGVVDVYYCGSCIEQAARLVGSASREEVEKFAYDQVEKDKQIERLKDEVSAWQQRFETMVGNMTGDPDWKNVIKDKSVVVADTHP
jgi:hypothetical protein